LEGGSLDRLQKCANTLDRRLAGLSPPTQIEHETRISNHIAPETGWRSLAPIQELLDFTK